MYFIYYFIKTCKCGITRKEKEFRNNVHGNK